jgi:hypothetical protein
MLQNYLSGQLATLSYQFTSQIHALTAGGKIDSVVIQPNQMIMNTETPTALP